MASQSAIEEQPFQDIYQSYKKLNSDSLTALKQDFSFSRVPIDPSLLVQLQPFGGWKDLSTDSTEPLDMMKANWLQAVRDHEWAKMGYAVLQAKEKGLLKPMELHLVRAISLNALGANAECLLELQEALKTAEERYKNYLTTTLMTHYLASLSKESLKPLVLGLIPNRYLSPSDSFLVVYSAEWAGITIPNVKAIELLKSARSSTVDSQAAWARARLSDITNGINKTKPRHPAAAQREESRS